MLSIIQLNLFESTLKLTIYAYKFKKSKFDCVIALGAVYIHTLNDAIKLLKKSRNFLTVKALLHLQVIQMKRLLIYLKIGLFRTLLFKKKDWKKL